MSYFIFPMYMWCWAGGWKILRGFMLFTVSNYPTISSLKINYVYTCYTYEAWSYELRIHLLMLGWICVGNIVSKGREKFTFYRFIPRILFLILKAGWKNAKSDPRSIFETVYEKMFPTRGKLPGVIIWKGDYAWYCKTTFSKKMLRG